MTYEEPSFADSQNDSDSNHSAVRCDSGSTDGNNGPGDHDATDPFRRGEAFEEQVGGELKDNIGDEEAGYHQ